MGRGGGRGGGERGGMERKRERERVCVLLGPLDSVAVSSEAGIFTYRHRMKATPLYCETIL